MPTKKAKQAKRPARPVRIDPNQSYNIPEICAALRISRGRFYELIATDELDTYHEGAARRASGQQIINYLARKTARQPTAA